MRSTLKPRHMSALATLAFGATLACMGDAAAQGDYPAKTIRIVSINAAGGPADMSARLIGDRLSAAWKQPVVVESIVGAGGNLAAAHVAKAPPDGYTLLMTGDAAIVTNISLYKKMAYDPVRDLIPITQVALTPNILTVHNDVPAKTAQELAAFARAQNGKLTYGHGGLGFSTHLAGQVFKSMAKADIQHVPYKTGQALMTDLLTGRITMCFCNVTQVLPHVREGKLRALAATGLKRSAQAPDIPTMDETGFRGFDVTSWFALMAPAGTPAAIIDKVYRETSQMLAQPDFREKFDRMGMEVVGNSPTEFAALIKAQIPQRRQVIEAAGITID
jgi:tripartite-type tricarboxylate transporter receptor subunit TctC